MRNQRQLPDQLLHENRFYEQAFRLVIDALSRKDHIISTLVQALKLLSEQVEADNRQQSTGHRQYILREAKAALDQAVLEVPYAEQRPEPPKQEHNDSIQS